LLSIKPPYASAIFDGTKQFEFRRNIFRRPVDTVVVYVTSPVGLVLGEFDVVGVIEDHPDKLWRRTRRAAGIEREPFLQYFAGCDVGYAIEIGNVRRYASPFCINERLGIKPPQSFAYLSA
jgi:predicted transcriptional regulator